MSKLMTETETEMEKVSEAVFLVVCDPSMNEL